MFRTSHITHKCITENEICLLSAEIAVSPRKRAGLTRNYSAGGNSFSLRNSNIRRILFTSHCRTPSPAFDPEARCCVLWSTQARPSETAATWDAPADRRPKRDVRHQRPQVSRRTPPTKRATMGRDHNVRQSLHHPRLLLSSPGIANHA